MSYKLEYETAKKTKGVQFPASLAEANEYISRRGKCSATLTGMGKKWELLDGRFQEVES